MHEENEKTTMDLSTKEIKSLLFHYQASFPGKTTKKERKKIKTNTRKNGSTNETKCLLLHYQPSFPGKKTKKVMHETKKNSTTNKTK